MAGLLLATNVFAGEPSQLVANLKAGKAQTVDQMYRDVARELKLPLIDHYANWAKILAENPVLFMHLCGKFPEP